MYAYNTNILETYLFDTDRGSATSQGFSLRSISMKLFCKDMILKNLVRSPSLLLLFSIMLVITSKEKHQYVYILSR